MSTPRSVKTPGTVSHERLPQAVSGSNSHVAPKSVGKKRTSSNEAVSSSGKELITYIFPDFKAVEYFRKDFLALDEFHILEKTEATGFEIYFVDQWIRDRKIGSVASVFTGNLHSKVKVCKFTTTKRQSRDFPPKFQEYLNELLLNHATFKRMDLVLSANPTDPLENEPDIASYLLVTNISAMPHNLFLIPIPEGDVRAVGRRYMVNSNLKKLNCGGRSLSLLAEKVSDASEDKFRQMYYILNESVPIQFAILELVNIVQMCLFYFDLLDAKYCDGLLCHKTEEAIKSWWNLIGLPHFNSKPNHKSGILSSKTVAAIISLTVSVKIRLQLIGGCDVPKDPFDAGPFLISVGNFQKQIKIERRRKLNLVTLSRLFYYTNHSNLSEKPRSFYPAFGNELSLDDSEVTSFHDQSYTSPTGAKNYSSNSLPSQAASAYRRNKIYYSKELKKLTNVVKNSVQDHIMVKEDQDDMYKDTLHTKPTTKLRNKIALKLSDNLVPAEIETTDIEIFAKKCVVGKVLQRLWVGLSSNDVKLAISQVDDEKNTTKAYLGDEGEARNSLFLGEYDGYTFFSFCDVFSANQDLSQVADKSGRLGRIKLTFQTRKSQAKAGLNDRQTDDFEKKLLNYDAHGSMLDTGLQKLSDSLSLPLMESDTKPVSPNVEIHQRDISSLSRRNSYPFVRSAGELNLRVIGDLRLKCDNTGEDYPPLKKTESFSILEEYYCDFSSLASSERARIDFLAQVTRAISLESMRKEYEKFATEVTSKEKLINLEAQRMLTSHSMMVQRKLRFNAEYATVLDIRMKDLANNLEKMAFRSRDLLKKIDELDEQLNIFETKLQAESIAKLDAIINRVLHSSKFDCVFEDHDAKLKIIQSLTDADHMDKKEGSYRNSTLYIHQVIVFFYQVLMTILGLFHFDRSKMNLDRIRGQYKKLDPNRKYISKIYRIIGQEMKEEVAHLLDLKTRDEGA